ncbi:MAG: NADP-specific glutamate dehydrogenase [Planctomycetota bacterium]
MTENQHGGSLFQQAFDEVAADVKPVLDGNESYRRWRILDRLSEPDRVLGFTVRWTNDKGEVEQNRAWRVQYCNALGPYKGGLRFHPSVNEDTLRFLGFEQCFKNALTGLPMGGGKGGSDFNPKGRSEHEIMRFCHAFMDEYHRYGGEDIDVPAGDIGVGGREVGFLFGRWLRLTSRHTATLTGRSLEQFGIKGRTEATGYGTVEFARLMLDTKDETLEGKRVLISGAGNVAQYAAERSIELGAQVLTLSNSEGTAHFPEGLTQSMLETIQDARNQGRRLKDIAGDLDGMKFEASSKPWGTACDVALPCATQNELDGDEAKTLLDNGCTAIAEGANMPSTTEAVHLFREKKVLYGPGKAANAGGVAVSGLEMAQAAQRIPWTREQTIDKLYDIMRTIHDQCAEHGGSGDAIDYVKGANIAGFRRVADSLITGGVG